MLVSSLFIYFLFIMALHSLLLDVKYNNMFEKGHACWLTIEGKVSAKVSSDKVGLLATKRKWLFI